MKVTELNREQIVELKQAYMTQLADEGLFAELFGVDYDAPSWNDLANADEILSDEVVFEHYRDSNFVDDDFDCSTDDRSEMPWDYGKHFN